MKKIKLCMTLLLAVFFSKAQQVHYELQDVDLTNAEVIEKIPGSHRFAVQHAWNVSLFRNSGHLIRKSNLQMPFNYNKADVDFVDSLNGFVFYSNTQNLPVPVSVLFKTNNAGASWEEISLDTSMCIYEFDFINKDTGYVAGKLLNSSYHVIRRTFDGGDSWQNVLLSNSCGTINMIRANDNLVIYRTVSYSGYFRSTNYGTAFSFYNNPLSIQQMSVINSNLIIGLELRNGWIPQYNNYIDYIIIHESQNSGVSWNMRDTVFRADKVFCLDQQNLFAWGSATSYFQKSTDGGFSWSATERIEHNFPYGPDNFLAIHPDTIIVTRDEGIYYNFQGDSLWQMMGAHGYSKSIFFNENEGIRITGTNTGMSIYCTSDAGKRWVQTRSDYDYSNNRYCENIQKGNNAVYGQTQVHSDGQGGQLIRSVDKGLSWENIPIPYGNFHVRGMHVNSDMEVWLIGKEELDITFPVVLLHTTDGGITWQNIQSFSGHIYEPDGVYFLSDSTGFVYGRATSGAAKILKTNDAGSTWSLVDQAGGNYFGMQFINDSTGFVTRQHDWGSESKSTTDGGNTWQLMVQGMTNVVKRNDNLMYAFRGLTLIKSYDSGNTWQEITHQDSPLIGTYNLTFVNDTTCYTNGANAFGKITFPRTLKPVARVNAQDSVYCINEVLNLTNVSYYDSQHLWFINGVSFGNSTNLNYTFPSPGQYEIKLWVENLDGVDSLIRNITVLSNTYSSVAQSYTLCPNETAMFNVQTNGSGFSFQWQKEVTTGSYVNISNDSNHLGVNNDTLLFTNFAYQSGNWPYRFRCIIFGCGTDTTSANKTVVAKQPVIVTTHPLNKTVCLPGTSSTSFSVQATGQSMTYRWQENSGSGFVDLNDQAGYYSGATTNSLTVSGITASMDSNLYRCIVFGICPSDTSNAGLLSALANATATIVAHPVNDTIVLGDTAMFVVVTNPNNSNITYSWEYTRPGYTPTAMTNSTLSYSGADNDTLKFMSGGFADDNKYSFRCRIGNVCNQSSLVSNYGVLRINSEPLDVWPGDANHDGVANNQDILELGLSFGYFGVARVSPTNSWTPQYSDVWYTASNGLRNKHADCDGDGQVYLPDTLAVNLNYGLMHTLRMSETNSVSADGNLYFVSSQTQYGINQDVSIDVYLGESSARLYSFYGAAFTLNYSDNSLIQPGSLTFTLNNSTWVGVINTSAIRITKVNEANEQMYGAITRTTHGQLVSGYGKIGTIKFRSASSAGTFSISGSDAYYINMFGDQTPLTSATYLLTIDPTISIKDNVTTSNISIYPNPNNGTFTINNLNPKEEYQLEVKDILGRTVHLEALKDAGSNTSVKLDQAPGVYWIQVNSKQGGSTHKVIVE